MPLPEREEARHVRRESGAMTTLQSPQDSPLLSASRAIEIFSSCHFGRGRKKSR